MEGGVDFQALEVGAWAIVGGEGLPSGLDNNEMTSTAIVIVRSRLLSNGDFGEIQ